MSASTSTGPRSGRPEITTFLMFSGAQYGKAEEAIRLYVSLFPDSTIESIERHGEGEAAPAGELRRGAFTLAGQRFLATESQGDEQFAFTPAFSLYVECRTAEEATRIFNGLSPGGKVHMPLKPNRFSHLFAWFDDKYGVSWQVELPKPRPTPT